MVQDGGFNILNRSYVSNVNAYRPHDVPELLIHTSTLSPFHHNSSLLYGVLVTSKNTLVYNNINPHNLTGEG